MRKLDITTKSNLLQKETARKATSKSVLEAFEHIVELAEDSNFNEEFFEKAGQHIRYVVRKLKLSPFQTVLLALFVDRSEDRRILISEIARYVGCRTIRILRLQAEIDVLEKLRYLRASRSTDSLSYRVPQQALTALRENRPYEYEEDSVTDTQTFFDAFKNLMDEKSSNEISYDMLNERVEEYLEDIKESVFARGIKGLELDKDDTLLFIFMAHLFVENNDDNIGFHDIEDLYDERRIPGWCKREFRGRNSSLFNHNLIENVNEDGMARADAFKLTNHAKTELLCELNIAEAAKSTKGLIKADSLVKKNLIYNPDESKQIHELSSILEEERFNDVQQRLIKNGMRPGFCCIFYGQPGTGKTETVYQLARETGRDIMRVDVDKVKSCWVGESEKNIKALFDRYRSICKNSSLAPILLFNEADAVLGVRIEGASSAVDKMENSIQNIILQEMESLEGIMIATTNLTSNLDKAFERRFLYKIKFEKPTVEARAKIWLSMLPGLKEEDAERLASKFDLSGGEIENVVRKHTVNSILFGNESISMDELIESCRQERISKSNEKRIGF